MSQGLMIKRSTKIWAELHIVDFFDIATPPVVDWNGWKGCTMNPDSDQLSLQI